MECVAHDAAGGKGVYAVARCCVISGLRCQAHASPEPGRDAECAGPQHQLTGESHLSEEPAVQPSFCWAETEQLFSSIG